MPEPADIPRLRARWRLGPFHGPSRVHASADGRTTVCGRLVPHVATVSIMEPAISCRRCQELLESRELKRRAKEERVSPTIKYKGSHADFIKFYNDMQAIAQEAKSFEVGDDVVGKIRAKMEARLTDEVARGNIKEGTVEIEVRRDPEDPERLVVDFLPAGDALEETIPAGVAARNAPLSTHLVLELHGPGTPDVFVVGPDGEGGTIAVGAWIGGQAFVLRPSGDGEVGQASRAAMWAYASAIRETDPETADSLIGWIKRTAR